MLNICSLFQKFFGFIKSLQKKTYRNCMVIVSGLVLVSVICLAAKNFGGSGKNSVSGGFEKSETETDTDTDETDANAIIQDLLFSYGNTSDEEGSTGQGTVFYNRISEILNEKEDLFLADKKHASIIPLETEKLALSGSTQEQTTQAQTDAAETTAPVETTVAETTAIQETETETEIIVEETTVAETTASYVNANVDVTDSDYYWLTKIVEAEAGDQDEIGKILVVNVILNRVRSNRFPDTIKSVIFQNDGRTYQFEPVKNERIYDMNPTDSTIACVDRALNGEDYSDGALFFTMKTSSGSWFNTSLTFLFVHGAHYFYTY